MNTPHSHDIHWFAISTRHDFQAEELLKPHCDEVFFPKQTVKSPGKSPRIKAALPHILFIRTTTANAVALERDSRLVIGRYRLPAFWIYRYPDSRQIQIIPDRSIELIKLLTADDTAPCQIFNKTDFNPRDRVRVTAGPFKGYEGYVQRVRKNRHVIVEIEGICAVLLPYIHPDLLEKIE